MLFAVYNRFFIFKSMLLLTLVNLYHAFLSHIIVIFVLFCLFFLFFFTLSISQYHGIMVLDGFKFYSDDTRVHRILS